MTASSRRSFLALAGTGGAALVLPGCAAQPPSAESRLPATANGSVTRPRGRPKGPIVKPTPTTDFVLHGSNNAEMRFERMAEASYVTPNRLFFIRSHGPTPRIEAKSWKLMIDGDGVERSIELGYHDLRRLPSKTVTRFIDCAGNGRSFFETLSKREAKGDPWRLGAFGIAEWTGVSLATIFERAGLKKSAAWVTPVGLDEPKVQRPMPLAKALEPDTLLAYAMNGETLPEDHGFPARVIVSGWVGVANVKWVGALRVTGEQPFVKENTEDYVLIGPDHVAAPPAKGPMVTEQVIKSAVALPWDAKLRPGRHTLVGYAWSPRGRIAKVDVSLDGGRTFRAATLVGPNIERAGSRWELAFDAVPGTLTITPRATDEHGNSQIEAGQQTWNEKGYLFGAMVPHPATVAD